MSPQSRTQFHQEGGERVDVSPPTELKKGSTTELGSRSRRRILEHTIKLVGERGIKGTSVNLISKEVGIKYSSPFGAKFVIPLQAT